MMGTEKGQTQSILHLNEHRLLREVKRGFDAIEDIFAIIDKDRTGYIGGSYAAYMCSNEVEPMPPGDVDVFAVGQKAYADLFRALRRLKGVINWEESAIAYTITFARSRARLPIQLIKPHPEWQEFPLDILESFDMDVCRAVLLSEYTVYADVNAGEKAGKLLRIASPLRTLKRMMKYHARGVSFEDSEIVKVFEAFLQMSAEKQQQMIGEAKTLISDADSSGWDYAEDEYWNGE